MDYYANYGGLAVDDYVDIHIRGSATEMDRMRRTVALVPLDVRTLLDVGAGHGVFLEELQANRGISGVGIEITPAKVDYARSRGIDLRLGDAGKLDFGDNAFDAVVSCELLEHLPYGVFEAALREFSRVARHWVIITVPFNENRRFVRCPYCSCRVDPNYHFRSFPPNAMRGLVPGYELHTVQFLGLQRRSVLVAFGRRLLDIWPRFLVCPSCGFHQLAVPPQPGKRSTGGESKLLTMARQVGRWMPGRGKPVWMVGIFRRTSSDA